MSEIFNSDLIKYAQVFKITTAHMGDRAPLCRLLSVDYKDGDGVDHSQDIAIGVPRDTIDERLVELIRQQYAGMGFDVSAIGEFIPNDDGDACRVLYMKPSFLVEDMVERGLPVPRDMAAALAYAGIHPVNWSEFVEGVAG